MLSFILSSQDIKNGGCVIQELQLLKNNFLFEIFVWEISSMRASEA